MEIKSGTCIEVGGIDYLSIGATAVRVSTDGFGAGSGASISTDITTITSGTVPFVNAAMTIDGLVGSATYDWPGTISEILLFSRALTSVELRKVSTYLSNKWRKLKPVVLIGNSLMSGTGSTGGPTQATTVAGTNIPSKLSLSLLNQAKIKNDCYPGRTGSQIYNETPNYSGISFDGLGTVSVVWEGTNTLATSGSVSKAFDDIRKCCLLKRGYGKRVIVGTVLLRGDTGNDAKMLQFTNKLNALIRANYLTFADAIWDIAAVTQLQDFTNTTYFAGDKVHLTDAGYQVCADSLTPVVRQYL